MSCGQKRKSFFPINIKYQNQYQYQTEQTSDGVFIQSQIYKNSNSTKYRMQKSFTEQTRTKFKIYG